MKNCFTLQDRHHADKESGFSMVSMVVAVGISAMTALAILQLLGDGFRNEANIRHQAKLSDLKSILINQISCEDTMANDMCPVGQLITINRRPAPASTTPRPIIPDTGKRFGRITFRAQCNNEGDGFKLQFSGLKPGEPIHTPSSQTNSFYTSKLSGRPLIWRSFASGIDFCLPKKQVPEPVHIGFKGDLQNNTGDSNWEKLPLPNAYSGATTPTNSEILIKRTGVYQINFTARADQNGVSTSGGIYYTIAVNGNPLTGAVHDDADDCDMCGVSFGRAVRLQSGQKVSIMMNEQNSGNKWFRQADLSMFWLGD